MSEARVSKKYYTIYIPKSIGKTVGLREGSIVKMRVVDPKIVIEPLPNPFENASKGPKFIETSFEEFEKESEELQSEIIG